ncbi:hypothetical protein NQ117_15365 [Paenibacillus sp. SC116]|uniref:hypothetical protein n=1 Tax=Paenibacillus sp. SC116 TaxID=2968986 RepID=UPI00215A3E4E|nr:hypothetical protein [Paenibacillus sp. SC116]MCR8845061.1 hypothetical protein [Paenibacillus sp. SC116]
MMVITGCSERPLPKLKVTSESNVQLPVRLVSYMWNHEPTYGNPSDVVKNIKASVVSKGELLKIDFDYLPKEDSIGSHLWIESEPRGIKQELIDNSNLKVPNEAGEYIYSIDATWDEGSVSYAIKVKVE